MTQLDLSGQNLSQLNVKVKKSDVRELILSDNPLQEIDFLKYFPALQSLIASNTQITSFLQPKASLRNLNLSNNRHLQMLQVNEVGVLDLTGSEQTALNIRKFERVLFDPAHDGRKVAEKLFPGYVKLPDTMIENLVPDGYFLITQSEIARVPEIAQKGLYMVTFRTKYLAFILSETSQLAPFLLQLEGRCAVESQLYVASNKQIQAVYWMISQLRYGELCEALRLCLRENQIYEVDDIAKMLQNCIDGYNASPLAVRPDGDYYTTLVSVRLNQLVVPFPMRFIRISATAPTRSFKLQTFYAEHIVLAVACASKQVRAVLSGPVNGSSQLAQVQLEQTRTGIFARVTTDAGEPLQTDCSFQWFRNLKEMENTSDAYLELKNNPQNNHGLFYVKMLNKNSTVAYQSEPLYIEKNSFKGKISDRLGNDLIIRDGAQFGAVSIDLAESGHFVPYESQHRPATFEQLGGYEKTFGESVVEAMPPGNQEDKSAADDMTSAKSSKLSGSRSGSGSSSDGGSSDDSDDDDSDDDSSDDSESD